MTPEEKSLISCLACYIKGQRAEFPENLDWNKVLYLAQIHSLLPVVHIMTKGIDTGIQDGMREKLARTYKVTIMASARRSAEIEQVMHRFQEEKIYHAFFKGYQLKEYYPVPELRIMGDVDMLIHMEDRKRVDQVLVSMGYSRENTRGFVWSYRKGLVLIEVHTKLASGEYWKNVNCEKYFENAFEHVIDSDREYTKYFELNYHFIFLMFHLAKHFNGRGAGIRMFLDLAVYIYKFQEQMDWKYIERQLEILKLDVFSKNVLWICERWFGVSERWKDASMEPWVYKEVCACVMSGGVFGYVGNDGTTVRMRQGIDKKETAGEQSEKIRMRAVRRHLFPNKTYMRMYLPAVEKYPVLLPAAWVMRFFQGIFLRRRSTVKHLKGFGADVEKARKQQELLDRMGL